MAICCCGGREIITPLSPDGAVPAFFLDGDVGFLGFFCELGFDLFWLKQSEMGFGLGGCGLLVWWVNGP